MREIKFKAWDGKRICGVKNIEFAEDGVIVTKDDGYFGYLGSDIELLQYTGLKDKNGVEICEGDIVRHVSVGSKSTYTVTFDQSSAAFYYKPNVVEGATGYSMFVNEKGFAPYIVIGNCYENPDSL